MCWRCGYAMNASSSISERDAEPAEGDLSLCLNCGALYMRHDDSWKPATSIELATLSDSERRLLDRALVHRREVITKNLSLWDGHA
jgi:hypothetical protein